jgi:hypothetical protein
VEGPARPAPDEDPQRPATHEDLRALRRWLLVAGAWAVAASAIALVALLNDDDEPRRDPRAGSAAVERSLETRIETLERAVEDAPTRDDVSQLGRRSEQAASDASEASASAREAEDAQKEQTERIEDLEQRLDDLERQGDGGGDFPPPDR